MYKVYILNSESLDSYYAGYTNSLDCRLSEHNRKKGKYTDRGIPWTLVYSESYDKKDEALERERFIKKQKSKSYIVTLIRRW